MSRDDARSLGIVIAVGIMGVLVFVIGERVRPRSEPAMGSVLDHVEDRARVPATDGHGGLRGLTADASPGLDPAMAAKPGVTLRTLDVYHDRRAYPGAPPVIPHPVDPAVARTQDCNTCHLRGGFTPAFNAYVPVTPHPEYANCLQCHVESSDEPLFVETAWERVDPPPLHRPALPGSPPPIPHTLQLRDDCLACHGGPAAVAEIRTSHPERENCVQCHVPRSVEGTFARRNGAEGS